MNNPHNPAERMNKRMADPIAALDSGNDRREIAAAANRIDMIIAVFAFGVLFGMLIG